MTYIICPPQKLAQALNVCFHGYLPVVFVGFHMSSCWRSIRGESGKISGSWWSRDSSMTWRSANSGRGRLLDSINVLVPLRHSGVSKKKNRRKITIWELWTKKLTAKSMINNCKSDRSRDDYWKKIYGFGAKYNNAKCVLKLLHEF